MKLNFRQGLVRYQTDINAQPTFLQKSALNAAYVDLNVSPDPTIIAFAHKSADYVFEEVKTVKNAWGPFNPSLTYYLYWDINTLTAELSRGITSLPPIYSGVAPSTPLVDQHWFDTLSTCFKVWDGSRWIERIRCFAGVYSSSAVLKPYALGTQAGLNTPVEAGNIILDSFYKPLRQSDGSFATSTTTMSAVGVASKHIRFEAEILNLMALENMPRYTLVQARQGRRCSVARATDFMSRVIGMTMEDVYEGEISNIVSSGLVRASVFNWPTDKVNRPVFCGPDGQLTLTPPVAGVLQQVGSIYDTDAVFMNIFPPIVLDSPDTPEFPDGPPPPLAPVPDFTVTPGVYNGVAPFTVQFLNASTNAPTSLEWDFTNDGTVDSTDTDPQYTYSTPGTYNVRLRATNDFGSVDIVKNAFIVVTSPDSPPGFTNLQTTFMIGVQPDSEVLFMKAGTFRTITMKVRNDGLLTATNVQRMFIVYDMNSVEVQLTDLPVGTVKNRFANYTQLVFPAISSLATDVTVDIAFTLTVPPSTGSLQFEGAAMSPEQDIEASDNIRSITLGVQL